MKSMMCVWRHGRCALALIVCCGFFPIIGEAAEKSPAARAKALPAWITQPKIKDSINIYVIGASEDQNTVQAARMAAMEDAYEQLTRMLTHQAGQGDDSFDPARGTIMKYAQPTPGCFFFQEHIGLFDGWVQIAMPIFQMREWERRHKATAPP